MLRKIRLVAKSIIGILIFLLMFAFWGELFYVMLFWQNKNVLGILEIIGGGILFLIYLNFFISFARDLGEFNNKVEIENLEDFVTSIFFIIFFTFLALYVTAALDMIFFHLPLVSQRMR